MTTSLAKQWLQEHKEAMEMMMEIEGEKGRRT
jgi:hypothetical protein